MTERYGQQPGFRNGGDFQHGRNNRTITGGQNAATQQQCRGTVSGLLTNSADATNASQWRRRVTSGTLTITTGFGTVAISNQHGREQPDHHRAVNNASIFNNNAGGTVSGLLTNTPEPANAGLLTGSAMTGGRAPTTTWFPERWRSRTGAVTNN